MPPRKRSNIGQVSKGSRKIKILRSLETTEQRLYRLEKERTSQAKSREAETNEEYEVRLQRERTRHAMSRAAETEEEHEESLQRERTRHAMSRAAETEEEHEERLQRERTMHTMSRASETTGQRNIRLHRERIRRTQARQADRQDNLKLEAFQYKPNYNYKSHPKVTIGEMSVICEYCHAKKFSSETPGMCCSNGKIYLEPLNEPPEPLLSYISGTTSDSKHFLKNIRKYNCCFQMTSFGATSRIEESGFMPTFKIRGQIYHRVGSLLPHANDTPKFLQIYFTGDETLEVEKRSEAVPGTRSDIILNIQKLLHENNALVQIFKTALDKMPSDEYSLVIRADKTPEGQHERRFNKPTTNEVAIVIVGEEFQKRDIILQRRSASLERISETHRSYDALQYPIIFWEGEDGYHFNIQQRDPLTKRSINKKVSAMDYYAYRIMIRPESSNHILHYRQLFHQYIVDMYAKIESERLLYIRMNQQKLRVEEYIHLKDSIENDGKATDIGKMVILPSSFTGSPRHMHEYAQDAMSYVRAYGRPDFFITFTCNPAWIEIKEELWNDQLPSDRHDLTARVFKQKLIKLIDVITKSQIYGETRCWMYTVEWQKRGLPHAHILIWLKEKIRPTQIDSVISAEIPNKQEDPELFEIVSKNMIHGPCGLLNPTSSCMNDKKCTKKYPRQYIAETETSNDGYPLYRRRNLEQGGHTSTIKQKIDMQYREIHIDNRWVVPYSPLLCKMFHAHINVEICNSVKSIKYICKYINKGSDMAVFDLHSDKESSDEITQFQMGRYLSSNEAVWRILGFAIHERYPPVFHLIVHLENGQRVYFTKETAQKIADDPPNTTLTSFFRLCQQDEFAKTLLYAEAPKYYTWNKSTKQFCKRKQGSIVPGYDVRASDVLGRVYTVHPNNAELFSLRLLLHAVRGPTSFMDLKTVNGEVCETFREACLKLGLLEGDEHWSATLAEACLSRFSPQLRDLFSVIITSCAPSNPRTLWEKYKESLSEDILISQRRANPDLELNFTPEIFNRALIMLEDKCISLNGKTLTELGLPPPLRTDFNTLDREILQETSYNTEKLKAFVESNKPLLNKDQNEVYELIMSMIDDKNGGLIFLDAPGGTGKTFLINLILAEIRSRNDVALAIASSGIASTLLNGGRTAHSALQLPLNLTQAENPCCNISKGSGKAKVLQKCKIIVWDECTMAHKRAFEALDRSMRDLREKDLIMGGAVAILAGDFRQTLPIIKRGTPADEINASLKSSYLWPHVKKQSLSMNMRVRLSGDVPQKFVQQLLSLGEGKFPSDPTTSLISFPSDFCIIVSSEDKLIKHVFPSIIQNFKNRDWLCERAILAPKNDIASKINNKIQEILPGTSMIYKSIDTVIDRDQAVYYPTEFLNSLEPSGMPQHQLSLKIGSPIILLRNLDVPKLCNGTRLCVTKLLPNVIEAVILTGCSKGEHVFIPRIPVTQSDLPFEFQRLQFPVKLSFAMTVNKAQGQSLKVAGLHLEVPCFSHGQLYVACSRVGSPSNLYIYAPGNKTKNIVYPKALD